MAAQTHYQLNMIGRTALPATKTETNKMKLDYYEILNEIKTDTRLIIIELDTQTDIAALCLKGAELSLTLTDEQAMELIKGVADAINSKREIETYIGMMRETEGVTEETK